MIDKEILDAVLPVPDLEELAEQTTEELKNEGFVITNFHSGGVFYTLLMIVLRIKIEFTRLLRTILNNMFVSHASGAWLDLKVADYSKKRKMPQKARGLVTISRSTPGEAVKIAKGHVFKSTKDINGEELRFFALEASVLQKDALATDILVEAEIEGSRYNVPQGQITRTLTHIPGVDTITNAADWITREGSDNEDDSSLRARGLRSWAELAQRAVEDTFINAAEGVPGVLFAQADCNHPRGQGTVDVIVTSTAGEATEGLLEAVEAAVQEIAGPYDDILVKSSVAVEQDIEVTVTPGDSFTDEEIENKVTAILTELLAVRKGRRFNELTLSDINHAIRSGYAGAINAQVITPGADVVLNADEVIILGEVIVTVARG